MRLKDQQKQAFTLLEVMIAMAIVVILTGSILVISFGSPEKTLIEDTLKDVERLVLQAKKHCHSNQIDCVITVENKNQFVIRERATTKLIGEVTVPKKYKLQFKPDKNAEFQEIDRQPVSIFIGKSGLNTPASLQFRSNDSRGEMKFDPLTGKATQEVFIF